jgi:transposase
MGLYTISLMYYLLVMPLQKMDPSEIRSLYENGLSTIEISRLKNTTPAGVKACLKRQGVVLRGFGGRRTEKAIGFIPTKEFMISAMSYFNSVASDAAKHYNVKYATWIDWLERFDIPRQKPGKVLIGRPSHRRQDIPIEEAIKLSEAGSTYEEIAQKFNVSYGVVMRRMKEANHKAPWRRAKDHRFKTSQWHKRKVLQDLNITACEICSEIRALDFSHIKPSALGGPTEESNTLVLCQTHHHCYDNGTLTKDEFSRIAVKVRTAESIYVWTNGFYGGW